MRRSRTINRIRFGLSLAAAIITCAMNLAIVTGLALIVLGTP